MAGKTSTTRADRVGSLLFCPACGTLLSLPGDMDEIACEQCGRREPASCELSVYMSMYRERCSEEEVRDDRAGRGEAGREMMSLAERPLLGTTHLSACRPPSHPLTLHSMTCIIHTHYRNSLLTLRLLP